MGQKVHPYGFRLGITLDWLSRWFAMGKNYGKLLMEDMAVRKRLEKQLSKAEISKIEIEKTPDSIRVILHSGRPGVVIGKKGQEIETLRAQLASELNRANVEISVQEVQRPELDAMLVAKSIAEQLEKRASYKKVMKRAASTAMRAGAKGVKIYCAGRLAGAEIARTEATKVGSMPLHTLRADIDYGFAEALTTYGIIGVKVLICKGEFQSRPAQQG